MAEQLGDGVSRTLSALNRQFSNVVWQQGKPPLDSELNLVGQIGWEAISDQIREQVPSGFLIDPTLADKDYSFLDLGSNYFELGESGKLTAVVNGWVIPLTGTNKNGAANAIKLPPPPTSNARTDLVFLEAFRVVIEASPSTSNKPSDSSVWRYGNTLYGGSDNPSDEMIDGAVGFETTRRVQVQHRIRVVSGVDIGRYPEGLNSTAVSARGTSASPVNGFGFSSMTSEGDNGLWRAGDGDPTNDLGTVDGYVYAIPICAVFRRNSSTYVSVSAGGTPEHNGAPNRTPSSSSAGDAVVLTQAVITNSLSATATGAISISDLLGSGLDDQALYSANKFIVIGSGLSREIVEISGSDTGTGTVTVVSRGRAGTGARYHPAGTQIHLYNERPDGLFSDQITSHDVMDLRHSVSPVETNYERLLQASVQDVLKNELRTTFKTSANGSDSKGVVVEEVSVLGDTSYTHASKMDAPDGIRTIWSDASVYQSNLNLLLDFDGVAINADGYTTTSMNANIANQWTSAPDFYPTGWLYPDRVVRRGTTISLKIGGQSGATGARRGLNTSAQKLVRFVHPREMMGKIDGDKDPFKLRLFGGVRQRRGLQNYSAGNHRTNLYLNQQVEGYDLSKDPDFMVFGDALLTRTAMTSTAVDMKRIGYTYDLGGLTTVSASILAINLGADFDTTGDNLIDSLRNTFDQPTLYNLLTDNGNDLSGQSSELYLHVYGDPNEANNNGAFKILGMGNLTPWSEQLSANGGGSTWVYVQSPFGWGSVQNPKNASGATNITASIRIQHLRSNDEQAVLVITALDLEATSEYGILTCSVQWPAGQGATSRPSDKFNKVEVLNTGSGYVKNKPYSLDADPSALAIPNALPLNVGNHITTMPSIYKNGFEFRASSSIALGRDSVRESDCYIDVGSKTVVLRPARRHTMSLESTGFIASYAPDTTTETMGSATPDTYSDGVTLTDGGSYFTATRSAVYALPIETLPSFGRQDIPYHTRESSSDPILEGLNHIFLDSTSNADEIFNVIGGENNSGTAGVYPALFCTDSTLGDYGEYVTGAQISNQEGYVARKITLSSELNFYSDFPYDVGGIEIPPYMGFARVYGVYEVSDFSANVANGNRGAHEPDRLTPLANGPVNLLKTDASKFTMFIRQDGASEDTQSSGSHTYVLTENAIDLTKIPGYTDGEVFDDYDYIIECVVFGFAENFISSNNLVLTRRFSGNGVALNDAPASVLATDDLQPNDHLLNAEMIFPSALPYGSEVVISQRRTVYQGDPYHTRDGSAPQYADTPARLGQLNPSLSYDFSQIRTLRETDGSSALDMPNPRRLQVLASMNFYTTLGTGAIGGQVSPSTVTDVGYLFREGNRNVSRISLLNGKYAETGAGAFTAPLSYPSLAESASLNIPESAYDKLSGVSANSQGANATLRVALEDTLLFETETYELDGAVYNDASFTQNMEDFAKAMSAGAYVVEMTALSDSVILKISPRLLGAYPNRFKVSLSWSDGATEYPHVEHIAGLRSGDLLRYVSTESFTSTRNQGRPTSVFMSGGVSVPANAGGGYIPTSLVGATSRLPIGLLVNDFDFLCEDPLNNQSSYLSSRGAMLDSPETERIPTADNGLPYTRVLGGSGEVLEMVDGVLYAYTPYSTSNPQGTRKYRMSRGGGSVFGVSGNVPGGPLTWIADSIPEALQPVLKGGALACRAMLVRNTIETAYEGQDLATKSNGGEIQLVIATSAVYRDETGALRLGGAISPSGYGEGYSASDRYLVKGRPLTKVRSDLPSDEVIPASTEVIPASTEQVIRS